MDSSLNPNPMAGMLPKHNTTLQIPELESALFSPFFPFPIFNNWPNDIAITTSHQFHSLEYIHCPHKVPTTHSPLIFRPPISNVSILVIQYLGKPTTSPAAQGRTTHHMLPSYLKLAARGGIAPLIAASSLSSCVFILSGSMYRQVRENRRHPIGSTAC